MKRAAALPFALLLASCGASAIDDDASASSVVADTAERGTHGADEATPTTVGDSPVIVRLRTRDGTVDVTAESLDARGGEQLREMRAEPTGLEGIHADIDPALMTAEPAHFE